MRFRVPRTLWLFFCGVLCAGACPVLLAQTRVSPLPAQVPAASFGPLDINTATPAQLRALPGMGDAYVRRIFEGRPYTAKNQLVTRGILPHSAYEQIREWIVAHRVLAPR